MMSTRVLAEKLKRERKKCKKLKSTNEDTSPGRKTKKRKQKTKCRYTTRKQIPKKRDENHPQSEKEKSKIVSAIEVAKKTPIIQPCFRRTNSIYPTNLYCPRQRIGSTSCS
jgi:hypothetical protein